MKGYWKRPEISREALRGGWMHTGDIGRFDSEGFLYILDRKKDMIKPGGENVYSPEVESMILAHPSVLEASVIGVPCTKWGESIRAVVVCRPDHAIEEMELIAWCRDRTDAFQMSYLGRRHRRSAQRRDRQDLETSCARTLWFLS